MQMMWPLAEIGHGFHAALLRLAVVDGLLVTHGGVSWQEGVWRGDAGRGCCVAGKAQGLAWVPLSNIPPPLSPPHKGEGDADSLRQGWDGTLERVAFGLHLTPAEAGFEVVVDQAHGLHEGVAGGGADEVEAAFAQVF